MPDGLSISPILFANTNANEQPFIQTLPIPESVGNSVVIINGNCGVITYGNPDFNELALCGLKSSSYYDLFYDRIWIIPTSINFTGIAENTNIPVIVWNSYTSTKTLSTVTITTTGVNQTLANNTSFLPLESKTANFSYNSTAPISLIGTATFTFTDAEDPMLQILGSRIEVFMFNHNWESAVSERYSFLTDVIEGDDGYEQAIRIKQYPSRELTYDVLLLNSSNKNDIAVYRAYFDNFLSYNQDKYIGLPILTDKLLLPNNLSIGSNSITFSGKNPQLYDFYANGSLLIYDSYSNFEIIVISSITSTTINLATNTTKAWNRGAVVVPIRQALFESENVSGNISSNILESYSSLTFKIKVEETTINPRFAAYSASHTYKSYPVYFPNHNWESEKPIESYKNFHEVGTEYGILSRSSRMSLNRKRLTFELQFTTRQELCNFLGFYDYLKGKFNNFWLPEYNNAFQMVQNYTSGQNFIKIKNIAYTKYISQNAAKRNLIFRHVNGNIYFNKITNSMDNGDGTETIYLEDVFGFSFTATDMKDISHLYFCRSDSDSLEISYDGSQELVRIQHAFLQLTTSP